MLGKGLKEEEKIGQQKGQKGGEVLGKTKAGRLATEEKRLDCTPSYVPLEGLSLSCSSVRVQGEVKVAHGLSARLRASWAPRQMHGGARPIPSFSRLVQTPGTVQ